MTKRYICPEIAEADEEEIRQAQAAFEAKLPQVAAGEILRIPRLEPTGKGRDWKLRFIDAKVLQASRRFALVEIQCKGGSYREYIDLFEITRKLEEIKKRKEQEKWPSIQKRRMARKSCGA